MRKSAPDEPENVIYALIDPRSLLIRYIGLSSNGISRAKDHRRPSCPDTYCRRWVKSLQRLGLDYEIFKLETFDTPTKLAEAERWWIAYGRACGWPLTNIMDGGGMSEETILKKRRQREFRLAEEARHLRDFYTPEEREQVRLRLGIPMEIERQCFEFFDTHFMQFTCSREAALIDAAIAKIRATRATVTQVYEKWQEVNPTPELSCGTRPQIARIERLCLKLFAELKQPEEVAIALRITLETTAELYARWQQVSCFQLFDQWKQPPEVASELRIALETVTAFHKRWMALSYRRGKRAVAEERAALIERIRNASPDAKWNA